MNNTKKHNRKDSRHKLKNKRRIKQSNKKRITKRVTKKNRKTFRGGENMNAEFIKGAFKNIADESKGVEGPYALKAVEFKKDNPTICNVYRFTEKTSGKIVYILTDFENIKTALFYEIIFNFCFALAIPLDIAWFIFAFAISLVLCITMTVGLLQFLSFFIELAINGVIYLSTGKVYGMPMTDALVNFKEGPKIPSFMQLASDFKKYSETQNDDLTIKALICKLKNYFSVNSSMKINEGDFDKITFKQEEQNNFVKALYPSSSIKTVLFLKEKDDGSGFGIGYVDLKLHAFVEKKFIFTEIDMSSLNLETLNNFFTNNDDFHENLTARFKKLTDNNTKDNKINESMLVEIGKGSNLVALITKSDEEKAAFNKQLMDSGAFDNVKLDLYAPRRIGETNSVRPHVSQQQIETMSYNPYIVNRANAAKSRIINARSRLGTPFPPAPPQSIRFSPRQSMRFSPRQSIRFSPRQSMVPQQSMPPPPPV